MTITTVQHASADDAVVARTNRDKIAAFYGHVGPTAKAPAKPEGDR